MATQKLQDSDYYTVKILSLHTVTKHTEMSHSKPELNATKGIRTTVVEQKQQQA